ncbi:MAG: DNA polymerase IV [Bdellovibrionales bacterium]|nr:DNA polymerase IV [Bdellovibrionales bacterium]
MRKIIHIDMDCFYAAVEIKHRPDLRGKPLGIGGPANSRAVLCTASYEARKFGVRSAMPSSQAVRLCPDLILLPPNFPLYKKESRIVRSIFERYTPHIQPLSLDEAYLDVTEAAAKVGSATAVASAIRRDIFAETKLTASAGIAPNKFLAKIASDWNKPNGQFVIRPTDIDSFMKDLKIEKIWGVGKVTAKKMHELGLHTCGDIQKYSLPELARWFGSRAQDLFDLARGIDHRPVDSSSERKSLTVEETYNKDLTRLEDILARVPALFEDWDTRMRRVNDAHIRGFVVKLKFHDFKTTTHEMSSRAYPTEKDFKTLLTRAWERREEPVRLVGLGVRLVANERSDEDTPQLSFAINCFLP